MINPGANVETDVTRTLSFQLAEKFRIRFYADTPAAALVKVVGIADFLRFVGTNIEVVDFRLSENGIEQMS
jgi:hypothetical protein